MPRIVTATYQDAFSAHKNSLLDFQIGLQHGLVGCNKRPFAHLEAGDYVIIQAKHKQTKHVLIGKIEERIEAADLRVMVWHSAGGNLWDHNYLFTPVTSVIEWGAEWNQFVHEKCECESNVSNEKLFAHVLLSFPSEKYMPIVEAICARANDV